MSCAQQLDAGFLSGWPGATAAGGLEVDTTAIHELPTCSFHHVARSMSPGVIDNCV